MIGNIKLQNITDFEILIQHGKCALTKSLMKIFYLDVSYFFLKFKFGFSKMSV